MKDLSTIKKHLVVSSNDLVHAKYEMTLWQKRLFVYAISHLQKTDTDFQPIRIEIKDLIRFFKGSDASSTYKAISEAPKYLDRVIEVPYLGVEGYPRYGFVRLLQKYSVPSNLERSNQYVELLFNAELKPHLLELREKFLCYNIQNIIELQSTYSFRLFELLKSYEYRKEIEFEVDYLRDILQLQTLYKAYKDFKKRIIDKAQQDLLQHCDIAFTYQEKKGNKGKKIQFLLFSISKNVRQKEETIKPKMAENYKDVTENKVKKETAIKSVKKEKVTPPISSNTEALYTEFEADVIKGFGVTPFVLVQLLQNYDAELIRKQIRITKRKRGTGEAINIAGFFVNAVKSDYNDPEEAKEEKKREKERQKALKKQVLREELQELIDLVIQQENNTARKLLANDDGLRMRAIEYATKVITNSPSLQKIVEEKEYDLATLDLLFWKQDKFLHAYFIEAIKKLEPKSFGYLKSLVERVEELDGEIKSLA